MKRNLTFPAVILTSVVALICPARGATIRPLLLDAQRQFDADQFDQALKLYKQADEQEPGEAAIEYNLGLCHLRLGDIQNALQRFEAVASRSESPPTIRQDAFYNLGLVRAQAANQRLAELMAPATQPSDQKPAPDAAENVEKLQAIAEELLRAIDAFRKSQQIQEDPDAEHNIRAARITRRNVLGLLKKAAEAKEKNDILDDPRAYLDALIQEQVRQVGIVRYLRMVPLDDARALRNARRGVLRVERSLLERTSTLADQLEQFKEAAKHQQTSPQAPPATQPAEKTPREQIYQFVAGQLKPAIEAQRDSCAFLLDGELEKAYEHLKKAREAMRGAGLAFPLEPAPMLHRWRSDLEQLKTLVSNVKKEVDWLRDPLVSEAAPPDTATWDAADTAIHDLQDQIGRGVARLLQQAEHVSTSTQPAEEPTAADAPPNPILDKELNAKLADILRKAAEPQAKCLAEIVARNQPGTITAQDALAKILDEAIRLLPRSIEERLAELIQRQQALNEEVKGAAGEEGEESGGSMLGQVRKFASKLKAALFRTKPADVATAKRETQKGIHTDTVAVDDEVRKQIPSGQQDQPNGSAGQQDPKVQAHIEAGKHLELAEFEMLTAIEGLEKAAIEDSLRTLRPAGVVQTAQAKALEELIKALAALRPPQSQPHQDDQEQKKEEKKPESKEQDNIQDTRRAVERLDRERERAQRELYQKRARTVIKDW